MFQNCKTNEEAKLLYDRIDGLFEGYPDLIKLLDEGFWEALNRIEKERSTVISRVFPGKYQKVRVERLDEEDERLSELLYDMRKYLEKHIEFQESSAANFICSVGTSMIKNGSVSGKQYNALIDIYYNNNMETAREESCF